MTAPLPLWNMLITMFCKRSSVTLFPRARNKKCQNINWVIMFIIDNSLYLLQHFFQFIIKSFQSLRIYTLRTSCKVSFVIFSYNIDHFCCSGFFILGVSVRCHGREVIISTCTKRLGFDLFVCGIAMYYRAIVSAYL